MCYKFLVVKVYVTSQQTVIYTLCNVLQIPGGEGVCDVTANCYIYLM